MRQPFYMLFFEIEIDWSPVHVNIYPMDYQPIKQLLWLKFSKKLTRPPVQC